MRVCEKSAEAVVARTPRKRGGAKGRRTKRQAILTVSKTCGLTSERVQQKTTPVAA